MFFTMFEVVEQNGKGEKVAHFGFYPTRDEAADRMRRLAFSPWMQGRTFGIERKRISIPGREE